MRIRRIPSARVAPLVPELRAERLPLDDADLNDGMWLGAFDGEDLVGVLRIFERDGMRVAEDLYVRPGRRTEGVASALLAEAKAHHPLLWLVCDETQRDFYARRGFLDAPEQFPSVFADMYAARGEWPDGPNHRHVAMRWTASEEEEEGGPP